MNKLNLLSRAEMKKVMGGNVEEDELDDSIGGGSSPKIEACKNKSRYDSCTFDYKGTTYGGRCDAHMASELYCSTLI